MLNSKTNLNCLQILAYDFKAVFFPLLSQSNKHVTDTQSSHLCLCDLRLGTSSVGYKKGTMITSFVTAAQYEPTTN